MRRITSLLIVYSFLLLSTSLLAQEATPEAEGWQVVERCLGELPPAIPQSQWDFEGVIFSENQDGVRAIRTDVATSYFVALEGEDSFPSVGGFSPDGRWFAYPIGNTQYQVNGLGNSAFGIDALMVVSTDPVKVTFRTTWNDFGVGYNAEETLRHIQWVDNEHFFYRSSEVNYGGIFHAFEGTMERWTLCPRPIK